MEILAWLESSGLGVAVRESLWLYPLAISCHAIGMGIVVGLVTMISLRVLSFAPGVPIASFNRLLGLAWAGVALNLISGVLMFIADAVRFFTQGSFQIKMLLIVMGVITAVLLLRSVRDGAITPRTKACASLSLVFWFGAIIAGRATAYI
jgi:hypothetical protein